MTQVPVVIDASIANAASQPSQSMDEAREILDSNASRLFAPSVLWQEFTNGVLRLERRGITTSVAADASLLWLGRLALRYLDDQTWSPRAYALARRYRQSRIFDAIYYVCAEDLGADLWTCDRKFVASFGSERPAWLKLCPDDA